MTEIIELIIKWIVPFVLSSLAALINKVYKELKNKSQRDIEDHTAMKNSITAILRSQILDKSEYYLEKGYLSEYGRTCLDELYKNYEELGGNHGIDKLIDQVYSLPHKKKNT